MQWHPEFTITSGDRAIFAAFVAAARQGAEPVGRRRAVGDRVAKVLAAPGSARGGEAERWIAAGRVAVDGACWRTPACVVGGGDIVTESTARRCRAAGGPRLWRYHKPPVW